MVLEGLRTLLEDVVWLAFTPVQKIFFIGVFTVFVGLLLGSWAGFILCMLTFVATVYACRKIVEGDMPWRSDAVVTRLMELSHRSHTLLNKFTSIFCAPVDVSRMHSECGEEAPLSPRDTWSGIGIIEEELDRFIELVIRDFVRSWYDSFRGSREIHEDIRRILKSSSLDITRRLSRADTRKLTCEVIELYTRHLAAVMSSTSAYNLAKADDAENALTLEEIFDQRFHLHHALASEECEKCYVIGVARLVLSAVVPRSVVACRSVERMMVQIISLNILLSVINMMASSDWIYERIVVITSGAEGQKRLQEILGTVADQADLNTSSNAGSVTNQNEQIKKSKQDEVGEMFQLQGVPTKTKSSSGQSVVNRKVKASHSSMELNPVHLSERNIKGSLSSQELTSLSETYKDMLGSQPLQEPSLFDEDEVDRQSNAKTFENSETECKCQGECQCAAKTEQGSVGPQGRRPSADGGEVEDSCLVDPGYHPDRKCHISVSCDKLGESNEIFLQEELEKITKNPSSSREGEKDKLVSGEMHRRSRSVSPQPRHKLKGDPSGPNVVKNCSQPQNLNQKGCRTELFHSSLKDVNRDDDSLASPLEGLPMRKSVAFSISDENVDEEAKPGIPTDGEVSMLPVPVSLSGEAEVSVPLTDSSFIFQDVKIVDTETAQEYRSNTVYTLYVIQYEALHFSDKGPVIRSGTVKRRYREFVNLLSRLDEKSEYKKLLRDVKGPSRWRSMPFKNLDRESIEARRVFLETFLKALISKEALCNGPELREFLAYEGDSHIAFVKKPQEKTRFDKVIVRTVSGMFDKLKTSLPSLPQELPTLPFLEKPAERREASQQRHDPDNIELQFSLKDSPSSTARERLAEFVDKGVSGLLAGEVTRSADSEWPPPVVPQLPRLEGDGSEQPDLPPAHPGLWGRREGLELCDVILELAAQAFQGTPTWVVRVYSLQALRLCVGLALDRWLEEKIGLLTTREECHDNLVLLRDTLWPNGQLATDNPVVKTPEQLQATRQCAKDCLRNFFPGAVRMLVGSRNFDEGLDNVLSSVESTTLNKHLLYQLLDLLVERLFPEISSQDLQKIVLTR